MAIIPSLFQEFIELIRKNDSQIEKIIYYRKLITIVPLAGLFWQIIEEVINLFMIHFWGKWWRCYNFLLFSTNLKEKLNFSDNVVVIFREVDPKNVDIEEIEIMMAKFKHRINKVWTNL